MVRAERRLARAEHADHAGRQTLVMALGSMVVALLVSLLVLHGSPGIAAMMLAVVIWGIIAVINAIYAFRKRPPA
jgi:uncharacterized membrane protein